MDEDDVIALSALQHYLYCPRQCALIHVEQLWAESRHTAEGRLLHEKADQPKWSAVRAFAWSRPCRWRKYAWAFPVLPTWSSFIRSRTASRHFRWSTRGRPKAHRADEVQLCAQALCLESMLDQQIHAGALYYGATRRRVDVCFDDELRQLTLDTIAAVRSMLAAV